MIIDLINQCSELLNKVFKYFEITVYLIFNLLVKAKFSHILEDYINSLRVKNVLELIT